MNKPFFKVGDRVKLSKAYLDKVTPEQKLQRAGKHGKIMRYNGVIYGWHSFGVKFKVPLIPNTSYNYLNNLAECYLRRI